MRAPMFYLSSCPELAPPATSRWIIRCRTPLHDSLKRRRHQPEPKEGTGRAHPPPPRAGAPKMLSPPKEKGKPWRAYKQPYLNAVLKDPPVVNSGLTPKILWDQRPTRPPRGGGGPPGGPKQVKSDNLLTEELGGIYRPRHPPGGVPPSSVCSASITECFAVMSVLLVLAIMHVPGGVTPSDQASYAKRPATFGPFATHPLTGAPLPCRACLTSKVLRKLGQYPQRWPFRSMELLWPGLVIQWPCGTVEPVPIPKGGKNESPHVLPVELSRASAPCN